MINKFVKIFILTFFVYVMSVTSALCAVSDSQMLSEIENGLFGYEYGNEQTVKRVERIERHLYGSAKTGDVKSRITAIKNDTGFTFEPQPEKKNVQTATKPEENIAPQQDNRVRDLKESAEVEYPTVDKMEQLIFKTAYKKESIYNRLDRLEEKVFQKKYSNAPLSERVDRLSSAVLPKHNSTAHSNTYSASDLDSYYNQNGFDPVNDISYNIAVLEANVLKSQYNNEPNSKRLNRLEQKMFNRTFSTDTDVTRIQRIAAAYDAKQAEYKYENNRKAQNAATMTQIGGILLMILAMLL